MSQYDCDLFVVGAGSGGVRAARMAAAQGLKVVVAEAAELGGTCVNLGCIPKKLLAYAARYRDEFSGAAGYGWSVAEPTLDWPTLRDAKQGEVRRLNGIYQRLLDEAGAEVIRGHARLAGPDVVAVGERRWRARNILLATGGQPWAPAVPGCEHLTVSDELFHLPELPRRLLVVGGGYIALEMASIFSGLGCSVEVVYRGELFLRGFDVELRQQLLAALERRGVKVSLNTELTGLEKKPDGALEVSLSGGEQRTVDLALAATGRRPRLAGLGTEALALAQTESGHLRVDRGFRTSQPGIFAVGDLIGGPELTPMALEEAMAVVHQLVTGEERAVEYSEIPTAVFSLPELATVGLTEEEARRQHGEVAVYTSHFTPLRHTLTGSGERTWMKLLVDPASDRVLGAHMLGEDAAEIIQGLAVALKAGATKASFDRTLGIHPTAAEEFVTMRQRTR